MKTDKLNWYAKPASGGQGLVIDEDTGRNVAVAYDAKDTMLLAAAPRLLGGLRDCLTVLKWEAYKSGWADRLKTSQGYRDMARLVDELESSPECPAG